MWQQPPFVTGYVSRDRQTVHQGCFPLANRCGKGLHSDAMCVVSWTPERLSWGSAGKFELLEFRLKQGWRVLEGAPTFPSSFLCEGFPDNWSSSLYPHEFLLISTVGFFTTIWIVHVWCWCLHYKPCQDPLPVLIRKIKYSRCSVPAPYTSTNDWLAGWVNVYAQCGDEKAKLLWLSSNTS